MSIGMGFTNCDQKKEIKTLIITGGHDFEREAFFAMFESFAGVTYHEVRQPEANNAYASHMTDSVDVLIFYDMVQEISESQKKALIKLLHRGQNMLFLHHSLASYQKWNEFVNIIGGKYHIPDQGDHDPEIVPSTYAHDVQFQVKNLAKNHPVTEGISDFTIHDEIYGQFSVLPGVYPLLGTNHDDSGDIIGWVNRYGGSFIVYIQPGHDHFAYEDTNYRRLVYQAIKWLSNPNI